MILWSKKWDNYLGKMLLNKEKETQIKIPPWVSVNWPSNNWGLYFKMVLIVDNGKYTMGDKWLKSNGENIHQDINKGWYHYHNLHNWYKKRSFCESVKVGVIFMYFSSEEHMYVVFFFYNFDTRYKIQCNGNISHVRLKEMESLLRLHGWQVQRLKMRGKRESCLIAHNLASKLSLPYVWWQNKEFDVDLLPRVEWLPEG